jgi:hypothetical protein
MHESRKGCVELKNIYLAGAPESICNPMQGLQTPVDGNVGEQTGPICSDF